MEEALQVYALILLKASMVTAELTLLLNCEIALKEASETGKWLETLYKTDYIDELTYKKINKTCDKQNNSQKFRPSIFFVNIVQVKQSCL